MINELTRKNAHTELDHIFKTILPAHGMTERPEQIRLSHTMLDAMFENRIALSDAGTGIGKTYAYLTAAIVYSHSRLVDGLPFQPVIIATSSIALQNAIVREYLPFLSDARCRTIRISQHPFLPPCARARVTMSVTSGCASTCSSVQTERTSCRRKNFIPCGMFWIWMKHRNSAASTASVSVFRRFVTASTRTAAILKLPCSMARATAFIPPAINSAW